MTQSYDILAPAVGACLPCRQIFLVTSETPNCILCGQPPTYILPFPTVPPGPAEPAPAEPVEPIPSSAPQEELSPAVEVPPPAAGEEPAQDVELAMARPILALLRGIREFLEGVTESVDPVRQLFLEAGAEGEEADTAVGRLQAVRDFLEVLWGRVEAPPAAPMEPTAGCSADEG